MVACLNMPLECDELRRWADGLQLALFGLVFPQWTVLWTKQRVLQKLRYLLLLPGLMEGTPCTRARSVCLLGISQFCAFKL